MMFVKCFCLVFGDFVRGVVVVEVSVGGILGVW